MALTLKWLNSKLKTPMLRQARVLFNTPRRTLIDVPNEETKLVGLDKFDDIPEEHIIFKDDHKKFFSKTYNVHRDSLIPKIESEIDSYAKMFRNYTLRERYVIYL